MGKLIVIEGTDGSGKTTQLELLHDRLQARSIPCRTLDFPRYGEESSALVRMYLDGKFGSDPETVNPYAASTFFAVDRYASYHLDWKSYYLSGGTLISNRYTTSNATHQGAKLLPAQREKFFRWLYEYEFELLGLPAPDLVIFLDVPIEVTEKLMAERRRATGVQADIHEADLNYLRLCRESAQHAAAVLGWRTISCAADGKMKAAEDIHREVLSIVEPILKER